MAQNKFHNLISLCETGFSVLVKIVCDNRLFLSFRLSYSSYRSSQSYIVHIPATDMFSCFHMHALVCVFGRIRCVSEIVYTLSNFIECLKIRSDRDMYVCTYVRIRYVRSTYVISRPDRCKCSIQRADICAYVSVYTFNRDLQLSRVKVCFQANSQFSLTHLPRSLLSKNHLPCSYSYSYSSISLTMGTLQIIQ